MFFLYVYTEAADNVGDGPVSIALSDGEHRSCLASDTNAIRSIVAGEGWDWETVTRAEVETGDDCDEDGYPDMDNPDTMVCYAR
jgi:hypothetical protein